MERRGFFKMAAAAGLTGAAQAGAQTSAAQPVIERANANQPGRGKVFALITPHLDDGPIFAGGTVAKLLNEGYTGYFIRVSNDEKDSYNLTLGETVLANEQDAAQFVKVAGLKKCYDLNYRNHGLDDVSRMEIRVRLIFLFRPLKVDTVLSYDPWGHYEENPDHYVTAQAVEAACWMSGDHLDFPEQFEAGLKAHSVSEKYYFARGPQMVNRVVDIGPTLQQKITYIRSCKNMITNMVRSTNESLAGRGLRVAAFTGSQDAASDAYIQATFIERDKRVGARYGLEYAEEFHYIGPDHSLDEYIQAHAERI
ncbi:PIG-L deacetylase family protein [Edaphobacter modestus]|uniref:LmbE family N-acetylglucosaminyl deacetylase n=1 Tax=Edaphobacter modestus TaxID=388466 RepID=A0A4Q7YVR1_9BACT|nr:PIG-L family deacetylase [Edaphobacter modestus]RZU41877.1 LmbE family N-acetylglucosaminyl deacetylase [Edaphobacter modestus]